MPTRPATAEAAPLAAPRLGGGGRRLRALWRAMRMLLHVLAGLSTIKFRFAKLTPAEREQRVQAWARQALDLMAIELQLRGPTPRRGPLLLVINHVSWLDILAIHGACYCRFVSKADIRRWPLLGSLVTGAGTLYVERESRRDAMRVVHRMAERLAEGEVLAVFPEGTTSEGRELLPFHGNLLQAALSSASPVLPIALQFFDRASRDLSLAPAYIGDDHLLNSMWRTFCTDGLVARLSFGEPQMAQGRDRRQWATDLHDSVKTMMLERLRFDSD